MQVKLRDYLDEDIAKSIAERIRKNLRPPVAVKAQPAPFASPRLKIWQVIALVEPGDFYSSTHTLISVLDALLAERPEHRIEPFPKCKLVKEACND